MKLNWINNTQFHMNNINIIFSPFFWGWEHSLLLTCQCMLYVLMGARAMEFTTREADNFSKNSLTFRWSCALPCCLCLPKYHSSGSWHYHSLRRVTPGTVKMYSTMPMNDNATKSEKSCGLKLMPLATPCILPDLSICGGTLVVII